MYFNTLQLLSLLMLMLKLSHFWPMRYSLDWLLNPFDTSLGDFNSFLAIWCDKMGSFWTFPAQNWNHPFLQEYLVFLEKMVFQEHNLGIPQWCSFIIFLGCQWMEQRNYIHRSMDGWVKRGREGLFIDKIAYEFILILVIQIQEYYFYLILSRLYLILSGFYLNLSNICMSFLSYREFSFSMTQKMMQLEYNLLICFVPHYIHSSFY